MYKSSHFGTNELSVLCRVSFCACVILWSIVSWTTRILGQGNPPFVVYFLFFLLFLGLFYFSEKALRKFFLLLDSALFLKSVSRIRSVLPFNHKLVLFMLTIHYLFVESRYHDWNLHFDLQYGLGYALIHVYLLTAILTISLVRSFVVIPSLVLCSIVVDSPTVRTFLKSGKMNGPGQTRNFGASGDALGMAVKGPSVESATLAAIPVLTTAAGFVWVNGAENKTGLPKQVNDLATQTNNHRKELASKGEKLAAERCNLENERRANYDAIQKERGLFGSQKSMVQKEVDNSRIAEQLEKNAAQTQLNVLQRKQADDLQDEFSVVRKACDHGGVTRKGLAEILDVGFDLDRDVFAEGQVVTSVQVTKMHDKLLALTTTHHDEQQALSPVNEGSASVMSSVLEIEWL